MIESTRGVIITAERRMFAKTIVLSDSFLDMPLGARCLYMTMGMLADDDGFVNAPKSIMRQIGASQDDLQMLIVKKFVIPFESGIIVIKHWRINNYLQKDRTQPTKYQKELSELAIEENGAYTMKNCIQDNVYTDCIQDNVYTDTVYTDKYSIGKYSIDKDSIDKGSAEGKRKAKRFSPPSLEEVKVYCSERGNGIDAQHFIDYYTANGWKVGKNSMKDWKATVRTWERNGINPKKEDKHSYDLDKWEKNALTSRLYKEKEHSYDLDEWEEFAMNFDPTKGAGDDG